MSGDARLAEVKLEVFESQNEIIRIQADVINELFGMLAMHMGAEELDRLPAVGKINQAAMLRKEHRL